MMFKEYLTNQPLSWYRRRCRCTQAISEGRSKSFITKRAVEICRDKDAKEKEENKGKAKVNYTHVLDAFEEMFNSKTVKVL